MITVASDSWFVADESVKTSSDGLFSAWYVVIPLKPLIQPVKLFVKRSESCAPNFMFV